MPLNKCKALKAKTTPPIAPETRNFLKKSQCHFKDNTPWVCCSPAFNSGVRASSGEEIEETTSRFQVIEKTTSGFQENVATTSRNQKSRTSRLYKAEQNLESKSEIEEATMISVEKADTKNEKPEETPPMSALDLKIQEKIDAKLIFKAPSCGQDPVEKIVGGTETALGEFPWLALIGYDKRKQRIIFQVAF